jgi:hypothetical protein
MKKVKSYQDTMIKKYELTNESMEHEGLTLYRIRALRDFGRVTKGDLGGYIEKESNLSHKGDCWVFDNGKVYNEACVLEGARIYNFAEVYEFARVGGRSRVFNCAKVYGNANVFGHTYIYTGARVFGHARVYDRAHVSEYARISGFVFVFEDAMVEGFYEVSGHEILGGLQCYGGWGETPIHHL